MGRVLDPLLCVFLADIQSVGIGACMHVCVWYTELTCISNGVSKTDIVVGKVQCVCVCVDRWRGHSRCRAPLTTGVDIYPKVLPSAYCMLLAGPLPLQGALTTGVDIYPRVLPSACCVLLAGPLPLQGALNHWGRYLPQGPTICILCASGTHTHTLDLTHHNVCFRDPIAGRP